MLNVAPTQILTDLREGTATAHRHLEEQVDIVSVCQSETTYRLLLAAFYGFYEPFESVLAGVSGWEAAGFDWSERAKTALLVGDLRALKLSADEIQTLPLCEHLPRPASLSEAMGCAYVLEGATLGGRQITGVLEKTHIPLEARSFFSGYREKTGEKWKEFCAILQNTDPQKHPATVAFAKDTFKSLSVWLAARL